MIMSVNSRLDCEWFSTVALGAFVALQRSIRSGLVQTIVSRPENEKGPGINDISGARKNHEAYPGVRSDGFSASVAGYALREFFRKEEITFLLRLLSGVGNDTYSHPHQMRGGGRCT
jgi:hypothetical protein